MKRYQVVGIGNAIVDVISQADDNFLDLMGIEKGIMQLVERERGELLYGAMEGRVQAPGGSVANTLAGLGNLGVSTAFIGRVHDDALGRFYAQSMAKSGTVFPNAPVKGGELPTSRSMVFVSPVRPRSFFSMAISTTRTRARPRSRLPRDSAGRTGAGRASRCRIPSAWIATATTSADW